MQQKHVPCFNENKYKFLSVLDNMSSNVKKYTSFKTNNTLSIQLSS